MPVAGLVLAVRILQRLPENVSEGFPTHLILKVDPAPPYLLLEFEVGIYFQNKLFGTMWILPVPDQFFVKKLVFLATFEG